MQICDRLPLEYRHPWDLTFEQRLNDLCRQQRRIAYFYENPDTSTFRYRVFNMVEALNLHPENGVSASWFSTADAEGMSRFLDSADAIVLCRSRFGPTVDRILQHARLRRIPVLFDLDDLVFDARYVPLIIDTLDMDVESERIWDNWYSYAGRYSATMQACEKIITTNQFLADRVRDFSPAMQTRIIPNFLNRDQEARSREIWSNKKEKSFSRDHRLHIGYFSGTPTHNRDFLIAAPAIESLLKTNENVVLRIVGFLDSTKEWAGRYGNQIEIFPLQNYLALQDLIAQVEINVAPLQNNAFTNCKSELKYFEAAVVGTLTIASPVFNFQRSITDGKDGLLAAAHEWEQKLEEARFIVEDHDRYVDIAERAHLAVSENYGWNRFASAISAAVFE